MRQAFAGLLWSKQFYHYVVRDWLDGDPGQPAAAARAPAAAATATGRTSTTPTSSRCPTSGSTRGTPPGTSPSTASRSRWSIPSSPRSSSLLLLREWYMHPNGQLPAYEWAFGDVNPPVHAWAAWRVYKIEKKRTGRGDRVFLERVFQKLLLNFTWWVNRKDAEGNNVFQGGFLGLDNIGVFDRIDGAADRRPPRAVRRHELDGRCTASTCWPSRWSWPSNNPAYEDVATKFFEHFVYIADAMNNIGDEGVGLWDEEDGFFYDVLHLPDGTRHPAEGPLDGRADPAVRGRDARAGAARPPAGVQAAAASGSSSTGPI